MAVIRKNFLQSVAVFMAMTAAILLSSAAAVSAKTVKRDADGHVLVKDWKEYAEAVEKDLPQSQEKILARIIGKAEDRRLPWDFYDAVRRYPGAVRSYNWKNVQDTIAMLESRVTGFGSPVVTWNLAEVWPLNMERPDIDDIAASEELRREKNDQFYTQDRFAGNGRIPEVIVGNIGSDYEYLLWSAFMRNSYSVPYTGRDSSGTGIRAAALLEECIGDRYPEAAFMEFVRVDGIPRDSTGKRQDALEAYAAKYHDKGMKFYALQELVRMKFEALKSSPDASSDDYLALRQECANFEKSRRKMKEEYSLTEACTYPSELAKMLDFKGIRAGVIENTDTLRIELQNLGNVDVRILDADSTVVYEKFLDSPLKSYYIPDTLDLVLPVMDDGKYLVCCSSGETETSFAYERYTVSMAWQWQDSGLAVYLADFLSGKPVDKADVYIYYRDSLVTRLENVAFDGFTLVDAVFPEENGTYRIMCSHTDENGIVRQTGTDYIFKGEPYPEAALQPDVPSCALITDRAAYNPGDTLNFKAILYEKLPDSSAGLSGAMYKVWTGAGPVVAELINSSRKTVAADTLTVNDFGSVSGSFRIPETDMNGWFTLCVRYGDSTLTSTAVTVDEFVLPTFTVRFEPQVDIYFPGDTVKVRGRLESHDGRSLAAADVTYRVSIWNELQSEGRLEVAADGYFEFGFIAGDGRDGDYFYHNIAVKVIDATGETYEFDAGIIIDGFYLDAEIENEAEAMVMNPEGWDRNAETDSAGVYGLKAVNGSFIVASFNVRNAAYESLPGRKVIYRLYHRDSLLTSGETLSGQKIWLDLSSWPSGTYRLKASASESGREKTCVYDLVKTDDGDGSLETPFENFFKVLPSEGIRLQFGASAGPVWAVVQLFGEKGECLESGKVYLAGKTGEKGSLMTLDYEYKDSYPDVVRLSVIYFRNGKHYSFSHDFRRPAGDMFLPLAFSRFTDKALPGDICSYEIRTLPGVECAVSVFDVTTEAVCSNIWERVVPYVRIPYVSGSYCNGGISGRGHSPSFRFGSDGMLPFQLAGTSPVFRMTAAENGNTATDAVRNSAVAKSSGSAFADIRVRENFADVLAFYPFLRSDENGVISFDFTAGDKLSSYYVSLFAHDRSMNNNALRQKMTVSLPVTVSVMQPAYLYGGDEYDMQVALSNVSGADIEGTLSVSLYDGGDYRSSAPILVMNRPESVTAGDAVQTGFGISVPADIDTLGIKIVYRTSDDVSDGVFVTVPVSAPEQTLYESHSGLLIPGMSADSLYMKLRAEFVNVSGYGAVSEEISIAEMLRESIPASVEQKSPDVISAVSACLASCLAHRLAGESGICTGYDSMVKEVLSYQNSGGGFAWLKGAESSPLVTAVVLEYISVMEKEGIADDSILAAARKAVGYLDGYYFSAERRSIPACDINLGQYLYVRSLYAWIPLPADMDGKSVRLFARQARQYLHGKDKSYPSGHVLYKARRAVTVLNLLTAEENAFVATAGIRINGKLSSSLSRYMDSLKEYAADHRSGGKYYPNAVMPFRGLLENELYAHSVLCRLLGGYSKYAGDAYSGRIADGIRLWIMIQKETQSWGEDPAYLLALDAVMHGSSDLLSAKILVLTQKYRKPFAGIKASGNDISVKTRYLVEDDAADAENFGYAGYRELSEGDTLNVGDRILAVYELWSAENRSFVRLTAPRYASLRPEKQLSGTYFTRIGYSYREVKSDRSIWYMEVLPEETTVVTETLIVTQSGEFSNPVTEVVCLYAPHYRANGEYMPELVSERLDSLK